MAQPQEESAAAGAWTRNDALSEPSCLLNVLGFLDSPRDLCNALAVCKLWKGVADIPALWAALYARLYGAPTPSERTRRWAQPAGPLLPSLGCQ